MKKALVFNTPNFRTLVWDTSTKYMRDNAYVDLFNILDKELDAYCDQDSVVCTLIGLARQGNPEACEALLCYRRNKNGEQFTEVEVRPNPGDYVIAEQRRASVSDINLETAQ